MPDPEPLKVPRAIYIFLGFLADRTAPRAKSTLADALEKNEINQRKIQLLCDCYAASTQLAGILNIIKIRTQNIEKKLDKENFNEYYILDKEIIQADLAMSCIEQSKKELTTLGVSLEEH